MVFEIFYSGVGGRILALRFLNRDFEKLDLRLRNSVYRRRCPHLNLGVMGVWWGHHNGKMSTFVPRI
jgi:hypothetical protein